MTETAQTFIARWRDTADTAEEHGSRGEACSIRELLSELEERHPQWAGETAQPSRFEVIDETGRVLARYGVKVDLSYQDDGKTLKVFLSPHPALTESEVRREMAAGLSKSLRSARGVARALYRAKQKARKP